VTGEVHNGFWWGDLKSRDHLEDLSVDGGIILKFIKKWDEGHGLDWYGSGQGHVAGVYECGNELPHSIKCGVFLD
jgi:hypothetical protein